MSNTRSIGLSPLVIPEVSMLGLKPNVHPFGCGEFGTEDGDGYGLGEGQWISPGPVWRYSFRKNRVLAEGERPIRWET